MAETAKKALTPKSPEACSAPGSSFDPACLLLRHLNLNLLTAEQKSALKSHLVTLTIRDSLLIIFAEFAILGSILLVGQAILENDFQQATDEATSITMTFSGNNREIQAYNAELDQIAKFHKQFVPIGDIYGDVVAAVPPGIALNGLELDVAGKHVKISGKARSRDDLNGFRDALEGTPEIANLQSPLSNLFVKTDIPFEFTADLSPDKATTPVFIPHDAATTTAAATTTTPTVTPAL